MLMIVQLLAVSVVAVANAAPAAVDDDDELLNDGNCDKYTSC